MSLATLTRQPLRTPIAPTPVAGPPAGRPRARPRTARRSPAHGVGEPRGAAPCTGTVVDYANFDHAASTPALESVKAAVDVALRTYSSVHRGNGYASKVTSGWYEEARAEVGAFVGARADDLVVFTRNTTDSLNLLGRSLPRDTTTFVFETEHHAALLPWNPRRTVRLPVPGSVEDALVLLGDALAAAPDGPRLVVVAGASNVTGELWPVDRGRGPGPARTAPGWPWTPRSSPRTSPSTSPRSASTSSPSPATSSTPRSAPACSSAAPTGSTTRRRTCAAAAPRRR